MLDGWEECHIMSNRLDYVRSWGGGGRGGGEGEFRGGIIWHSNCELHEEHVPVQMDAICSTDVQVYCTAGKTFKCLNQCNWESGEWHDPA